jgi:hypothetical protein
MDRRLALVAIAVAASTLFFGWVSGGLGAPISAAPSPPMWALHGSYSPVLRPGDFVSKIDNRYFPLIPGTTFHYRGYSQTTPQTDEMTVTRRKKTILGISCTVVQDTVSAHGKPVERTFDWYAQDKQGNVWYMGEYSLELEGGHFVRAGDSWQSGVKGGKPGIIMRGDSRPGDVYRQEYYPPGGGLDQARIVSSDTSRSVPFGTYSKVLTTDEWSPVEPQIERKYYAPGVGEIEERVTAGGHERFLLVSVTH